MSRTIPGNGEVRPSNRVNSGVDGRYPVVRPARKTARNLGNNRADENQVGPMKLLDNEERRRQFGGDGKRLWRKEVHAEDGRCLPRNQEPSIIGACHQCIGMGERRCVDARPPERGRPHSSPRLRSQRDRLGDDSRLDEPVKGSFGDEVDPSAEGIRKGEREVDGAVPIRPHRVDNEVDVARGRRLLSSHRPEHPNVLGAVSSGEPENLVPALSDHVLDSEAGTIRRDANPREPVVGRLATSAHLHLGPARGPHVATPVAMHQTRSPHRPRQVRK